MISHVPGKPNLLLGAFEPSTLGYDVREYFVGGRATSYGAAGQADYVTRVVVLTPDPAAFNGTVLVEWLNVSAGIEGGRSEYLARFAESLDGVIAAGFLLTTDRQEILGLAAAAFPR